MKSLQLLFTLALSQCTLHEAARQANLECIQELDSFDELNEHGSNALHSALQGNNENGQIENVVKSLLEKGVSVEGKGFRSTKGFSFVTQILIELKFIIVKGQRMG